MARNRPQILFVQPSCQPPGGANGVAAWMLQVLAEFGQVTVLSWEPFRPQEIDEYYGTSLQEVPIENILWINELKAMARPTRLLQLHLFMRAARRTAKEYDLIASAWDEVDFGRPALEYIHYPWRAWPRPDAPAHWAGKSWLRLLISLYARCCCLFSGFRQEGRGNLSLVNSEWTGRCYQGLYPDVRPRVLYPPALGDYVEFEESLRGRRFLSIGRMVPCKELEKLVAIVARLRDRGHQVGLTLAAGRQDLAYERKIQDLVTALPWVELRMNQTRDQIHELMRTHRFGLHGMRDEHYGMAVAELVLGGCLTMVANDGGQVEIVEDGRLQYSGIEDAVTKLDALLRDSALESELRAAQSKKRSGLTRERFCREFRLLAQTLSNPDSAL